VVPYYHAHRVVRDKCRGHMTCMRQCPTQAIRIRWGKAVISEELCIDCGTCISVCPAGAIEYVTDPFDAIASYKFKVAVPSSALYAQFDPSIHPYIIHLAFKRLGFDMVVDVGPTCELLARATMPHMKRHAGRLPLISGDCPCVIRLLQVKFPDLVELIIPLEVPRELTAREVRRRLSERGDLRPEDVGIIYFSPCPAKIVSIKQPAEKARSWFNGALTIKDVYPILYPVVMSIKAEFDDRQVPPEYSFFDDIENSRLRNIDFIEAVACMMGCVGGVFTVENRYLARANNIKQRTRYERPPEVTDQEIERLLGAKHFSLENAVPPRPTRYFDTDLETSIKRMKEIDRIYQNLRQVDCGCCGAPTCKAFAEDCVRGAAQLIDCVFLSRRGGDDV
jgi:iron only hydrogenase large subunit-like protein